MTNHQQIAAAIARLKTPIFLARQSERRGRALISLYTTDRAAPRQLASWATGEFAKEGIAADCRVVVTAQNKLRRKSVEGLARGFGRGDIIYDPTGLINRSSAVVACATRIRAAAKVPVKAFYLSAERRSLFVILDQKSFPTGTEALLTKRVEAMAEIARAVQAWRAEATPDFELAIRIGFELPTAVHVVPVDDRSVPSRFGTWGRRGAAAALGSMLGLGALASANAADTIRPLPALAAPLPIQQPAVAAHNLDVLFAGVFLNGGGVFDNTDIAAIGLKGAVPIGQSFGLQVDAAVGTRDYWGIGGHLFWRDPSVGLIGVFASHETLEGATLDRFGGEGEGYLRNLTLRGEVGMQEGDAPHTPFAGLDLTFYVHPNFSLTGGARLDNGDLFGHMGFEWQPDMGAISGLSVFADGEWGDNDFTKVLAGVTFHFGSAGVSLIDRDRKYDPKFGLFNFTTLENGGYQKVN